MACRFTYRVLESTVAGVIKGPHGIPAAEASMVADKFWEIYKARNEIRARVSAGMSSESMDAAS